MYRWLHCLQGSEAFNWFHCTPIQLIFIFCYLLIFASCTEKPVLELEFLNACIASSQFFACFVPILTLKFFCQMNSRVHSTPGFINRFWILLNRKLGKIPKWYFHEACDWRVWAIEFTGIYIVLACACAWCKRWSGCNAAIQWNISFQSSMNIPQV